MDKLLIATCGRIIKRHEEFCPRLRRSMTGSIIIGWGYDIGRRGLPMDICTVLLIRDIKIVASRLEDVEWFNQLDSARQVAIVIMAYHLGLRGLLECRKIIQCLISGQYGEARAELLATKWARQRPEVAKDLSLILETGKIWETDRAQESADMDRDGDG